MVKIDVEAVGKMLDDLLAPVAPSPYEGLEPDYEFMPDPPGHRAGCEAVVPRR